MKYFFGVISILGHNADFGSKIQKNRREDDFVNPSFFSFCLQNQGKIEFSTSAFLSLKVEGIARGLSWIAWSYLSPRRICAHIGPHPLPQLVFSISGFTWLIGPKIIDFALIKKNAYMKPVIWESGNVLLAVRSHRVPDTKKRAECEVET